MNLFIFNFKDMKTRKRITATLTILLLSCSIFLLLWEGYWRLDGYSPNTKNSLGLWAKQRNRISNLETDPLVIIGSSRALFGLNLGILSDLTHSPDPIQLSSMKSAPISILRNLANDTAFKGFLIVGVTPGPFFLGNTDSAGLIEYYENESLNQKSEQIISEFLQQYFTFLDEHLSFHSLFLESNTDSNSKLKSTPKLANMTSLRQANMWPFLETNINYQKQIKALWGKSLVTSLFSSNIEHKNNRIAEISRLVNKIKARGGMVVFARLPSKGLFLDWEQSEFSRQLFWDDLLIKTSSPGFHFQDHLPAEHFEIPDDSHLSTRDAKTFTHLFAEFVAPIYLNWSEAPTKP